ncbi:TetR/AcrR family transcriptional regulator [Streptomyces sp. 142MFCol3.1]|uniref:TetR/AcrR family transcriptional regulator n=1 Tax=Streptomyces sp. 142MFCol3.1 TaxID=1172179 RepID=UPI00040DD9C7|nr:TetR/AcrR family transcriptional regulator [Streptomyces sp. 142MFCol3.1]
MPRPPDPAKRSALLDQVRAYLIRNGLADLSLRPLAQALGTSDRMLLYYFGSKERMVSEAIALDKQRPLLRSRALFGTDASPKDPASLRRLLEELWRQFNTPDLHGALPLYLEIMVASLLHPERYGPFLRDLITEWTGLLASVFRDMGMTESRARTEAGLVVDATLGLLMAPLADGDWDRSDAAFRALLDRLQPGWQVSASTERSEESHPPGDA